MTTSLSRGKSTSIFFKLCSRAPRTVIDLFMSCSISGRRGSGKRQTTDICATRSEIATLRSQNMSDCAIRAPLRLSQHPPTVGTNKRHRRIRSRITMNVWTFSGRVGADAELRTTQSGEKVLSFRVANDIGFGDRRTTQWVDCSMWGKRAESVANYVKK